MFGTRDLFSKGKKINQAADRLFDRYKDKLLKFAKQAPNEKKVYENFLEETLQEASQIFYLRRLYQQAKQVSQIIAYIWRWADADGNPKQEIANKLKECFTDPTEDNSKIGDKLKELLRSDPTKTQKLGDKDNLLKAVFFEDKEPDHQNLDNLLFPMFDDFELGESKDLPKLGYLFQITVDSFHGTIEDPTKNAPELMKFTIPYPPCPKIGKATVTLDELEHWIANREKDEYFAKNPYIPTSCS